MTMVICVTLKKKILRKCLVQKVLKKFRCWCEQPKKCSGIFFKVVFFYIVSISYSYSGNLEILQQHLPSFSLSAHMPIQSCKSVKQWKSFGSEEMSQKSLLIDTVKIIYPKSRKKIVHKQSDTEVLIYLT